MPKVIVESTKGLYQQSGSGFAFTDYQIEPSVETLTNQLIDLTFTHSNEAVSASWDGLYFLIYGASTEYVVWFDYSTGTTAPSVTKNPAAASQSFVEVAINGLGTGATVATAVATAIAGQSEFDVWDDATPNGTLEVVGATPYANCADAAAGTINTASGGDIASTLAQTTTGSGSSTKALDLNTQISVINPPNPNACLADSPATQLDDVMGYSTAGSYSLAAGTFVGQRKMIFSHNDAAKAVKVTIQNLVPLDHGGAAAAAADEVDFGGAADDVSFMNLVWTGVCWLELSTVSANVANHLAS